MGTISTEAAIQARVQDAITHLNAGDPDPLLDGYTDNVVVVVPVYRVGDPLGEPEFHGRSAFRAFLLRYLAQHTRYELLGVTRLEKGMMISLECLNGNRIALSVELNERGLGQRVMILHT